MTQDPWNCAVVAGAATLMMAGLALAGTHPVPAGARPSPTKACKGMVEASGHGKSMSEGLSRARGQWIGKVTAAYGASYANPGLADTSFKSAPPPCQLIGAVYRCTWRARPCRSIVIGPTPR